MKTVSTPSLGSGSTLERNNKPVAGVHCTMYNLFKMFHENTSEMSVKPYSSLHLGQFCNTNLVEIVRTNWIFV